MPLHVMTAPHAAGPAHTVGMPGAMPTRCARVAREINAMPIPFFTASDHLGAHVYFRSLADADSYQQQHGGYVLMTTPGRIWRVTTPCTSTT